MIYLVNIIYPWLQLLTNPDLNGTGDCYDSCGTSMGFIMVLFVPHLIIYGLPLITMILYSAVGQQIGTNGTFVKFTILYWARYLGLFWHIVSVLGFFVMYIRGALGMEYGDNQDNTWFLLNPAITAILEYGIYANGSDAVKYVDPSWSGDPLLSFKV